MVINFTDSRVSIDFSCIILEIQNSGYSQSIRPRKSYKHGFEKKYDGHKLCTKSSFNLFFIYHLGNSKLKPFLTNLPFGSRTSLVSQNNTTVINFAQHHAQSRVSIGFSCTVSEIQNTGHSQFKFRLVFSAPSQKFKILAFSNALAHGKSYEHGFTKKCDGPKLYEKLSFDRFFVLHLRNSKYWPYPIMA
ncbi:hypothetical protein B296_00044380 [Ensete ventricosum]|uniref:Uncharacterized protein n=1 Tax=Ensete ventricosum TaxID=4639 RepID=A0A426Z6H5_ENSVE|nr:hypothetical protein B296_00044380 [Ensete ventricosum]